MEENQDAFHYQCDVCSAYEPGLDEHDERKDEVGEQLLFGEDVGAGYGSTSFPGKKSVFSSTVVKASRARSSIVSAERHPYPELSGRGVV